MGKINTLDKALANQIAAWEVVERPASIIKELLENSIDAGATKIDIQIQGSGKDEIIITDNGSGIEKEDLPLTVEKYSTSKIATFEDLSHILSFWFRWEALASIASVSQFELIAKTPEQNNAYKIEVKDWEKSDTTIAPWENGTKITIKDLFYNTPARKQYLKTDKTEYSHIAWYIQQFALSHPEVWFTFSSNNSIVYQYIPWESLESRIYSIYGKELSENMLIVSCDFPWVRIHWYISDPKVSFGNKSKQSLFVNKRMIQSPLIYRAIMNAYNRFIPHGTFPAYVLDIDINPEIVDINVHPRKLEVRFAQESELFRSIYHSLQKTLEWVTLINIDNSNGQEWQPQKIEESAPQYYTGSGTKFKSYSPYKDTSANPAQAGLDFTKSILWGDNNLSDNNEQPSTDLHDTPLGYIIGQMHNSYIIVQTDSGMQILDQHALAERILYEKLVSSSYQAKTQWLLLWESLSLTPNDINILEQNKETIEHMWFEFEILSHGMVTIHAIPDFIKKEEIGEIFSGIISDIGQENFWKSQTLEEVRNKIFAFAACRWSIKFGNKLSLFEMNKLLHDTVLDYSATCPHGRPVVYEIKLQDLQNKYER